MIPVAYQDGDDYVECDECGHPIERHDTTGCHTLPDEACTCPVRFTRDDIRRLRREAGLPTTFNPRDF